MPIYEYVCDVCGERFELRQSFGCDGVACCPKGHQQVHRVFSPPVIVFKGSGFYVTDHPSGCGSKAAKTSEPRRSVPEPVS